MPDPSPERHASCIGASSLGEPHTRSEDSKYTYYILVMRERLLKQILNNDHVNGKSLGIPALERYALSL